MAPDLSPERGTPATGPQIITPTRTERHHAHASVDAPLRARVIDSLMRTVKALPSKNLSTEEEGA